MSLRLYRFLSNLMIRAGATNLPRIFDIIDTGDQAEQLKLTPSAAEVGTLGPDVFAQVKLVTVK
jgi:hypothetical protein